MAIRYTRKDMPLTARLDRNQVVIQIGVATLAFASQEGPDERLNSYHITNPKGFAKDVIRAMESERTDNENSQLEQFFEEMMVLAIQEGSEWVEAIPQAGEQ